MFSWEQALTSLLLIKLLSRYLAVTLLTYFYFLPRSFSHLFRSSTICYFSFVPRVSLFYPPLPSQRGIETLGGSDLVSPSTKLILREEYFVSQFFPFSPFSYWLQEQARFADPTTITETIKKGLNIRAASRETSELPEEESKTPVVTV